MKRLLLVALLLSAGCAERIAEVPSPPPVEECAKIDASVATLGQREGIRHAIFRGEALAKIREAVNKNPPHNIQADRLDLWQLGPHERASFSLKGCITFTELDSSGHHLLSQFVARIVGPGA